MGILPQCMMRVLVLVLLMVYASAESSMYGHECNTIRFRSGCFLDVLEKVCESVKDLQICASAPSSCKFQEEFPVTPEVFSWGPQKLGAEGGQLEAMWKCCCDAPDGAT